MVKKAQKAFFPMQPDHKKIVDEDPIGLHFNANGHEPRISGLQKNSSGHNSEESSRKEVDQTSGIVQNVQVHEPRLGH